MTGDALPDILPINIEQSQQRPFRIQNDHTYKRRSSVSFLISAGLFRSFIIITLVPEV